MTLVPFPRFAPDQSNFSPQASTTILNAKPTKDGWGPLRSLVGISDPLPAGVEGDWDVSTAVFLQAFSVATQDANPQGLFFKEDGLKMYVVGNDGDDVNEYDLSSAWDVSTAVFLQAFSVAAQDTNPRALFFKPDGLKMYVTGDDGDDVNEYDLSPAWDVSTAVFNQAFSVAAQETGVFGLFFKEDGLKMYVSGGASDNVNEYDLSVAWDVSTAVFLQAFSVVAQEIATRGLFFRPNGLKMYVSGESGTGGSADQVHEYNLSVAWDISTASFNQSFSVATEETTPRAVFFKPDGLKMYVSGQDADNVNEYDIGVLAGSAVPRGAISVKTTGGDFQIFAGTAKNLYKINSSDYSWVEVSKSTDAYNLGDTEYWRFAVFGNFLIATAAGAGRPQVIDLGTATNFADLSNANFSAALVWIAGDFLVFARVDGDRRRLKWSGVNDITFWTPAQRGSDEQIMPDGGDIQAGISQAQNALIVQESAVRQMQFDPSSGVVFRFITVDPERGAIAGRSVVNIGPNDFVYLAKDGFYRGLDAKPIGAERVDRAFLNSVDPDQLTQVAGIKDPFEKIVWWRYKLAGMDSLIGYDWQLDQWFRSNQQSAELLEAATVGYTLEDLDQFGNIDTLELSLDSSFWKGGFPSFAGFTTDNEFGFFDGPNQEAIFETEDKQLLYPNRAVTGRITVLVDTDDAEVAIASKETQNGTLAFGPYLTRQASQPFINSRVSGRFHRLRVKIPASTTWANAVGVDVQATDGGNR